MDFKKNRKNRPSNETKSGQFEENRPDAPNEEKRRDGRIEEKLRDAPIEEKGRDGRIEQKLRGRAKNKRRCGQSKEKRRDGQCKTGERIAESSESSESSNKSGQIYLLDRSLLDKIIRNLNGFSDLLSIQLHPDDVKKPILECYDVTKRLMNLPVYSGEDSGEVFIKLASGLKEELLDALVVNYDLAWECLDTSKEVRMKRVIRNDGLVTRLNELTFSVSKCEDDQKHCDDRVKHLDGQLKKTEHFAESSESSNDDKSKLTYKLYESLRDTIISTLLGFNKVLFRQCDAADEEKVFQDLSYVYMEVRNLPANSDEHLRPDELFVELASGVKEEILSALIANHHLTDICFEESVVARVNRMIANQGLVIKLRKLPISVSKHAPSALSKGKCRFLSSILIVDYYRRFLEALNLSETN